MRERLTTGCGAKKPVEAFARSVARVEIQTGQNAYTYEGRVCLTGLSMGGNGTWELAYGDPELYAWLLRHTAY
jgi:hypothetical protein